MRTLWEEKKIHYQRFESRDKILSFFNFATHVVACEIPKKSFNQVCFFIILLKCTLMFLPLQETKNYSFIQLYKTNVTNRYTPTLLNILELPISLFWSNKTNLFDFYFCFYLQTKCSPRIFGWSRLFVGIFISCALPKCGNYSNSTQVCSNHKGTISCASFHFQNIAQESSREYINIQYYL